MELPGPVAVASRTGIAAVRDQAFAFGPNLQAAKLRAASPSLWYPYDILSNFVHLERLLTGGNRALLDDLRGRAIADIGAADGDSGFFLETLGANVDIIDNPATNFNAFRGAPLLRDALGSRAQIEQLDLDVGFTLPRQNYHIILFLGILYHLKNPYYALETLSRATRFCLVSTRIARYTPNESTRIANIPVAYLVDTYEANNDPSNYWVFSDAGLKRIFVRSGWDIADYMTVGDTLTSDPATPERDERAFALLRSRNMR